VSFVKLASPTNYVCGFGTEIFCGIGTDVCGIGTEVCGIGTEVCGIGTEVCGIGTDTKSVESEPKYQAPPSRSFWLRPYSPAWNHLRFI